MYVFICMYYLCCYLSLWVICGLDLLYPGYYFTSAASWFPSLRLNYWISCWRLSDRSKAMHTHRIFWCKLTTESVLGAQDSSCYRLCMYYTWSWVSIGGTCTIRFATTTSSLEGRCKTPRGRYSNRCVRCTRVLIVIVMYNDLLLSYSSNNKNELGKMKKAYEEGKMEKCNECTLVCLDIGFMFWFRGKKVWIKY